MTSGKAASELAPTAATQSQHFGDRLVELRWNFIVEFDLGECARQHFVLLDWDNVGLGDLE
jgi:hypothetical protein